MCLITFAWDMHPKYKLILAANRDEFYHRATAATNFWEDHPDVLGGRDLQAGGTWMAISRNGRFAAVTNYRDPFNIRDNVNSRGEIPTQFLTEETPPKNHLQGLHEHSANYNGFNVLLTDLHDICHYSNYERKINTLEPGIYGLSNALLDTPWPKVNRARQKLQAAIGNSFTHQELLEMMEDNTIAPDEQLPRTGVSKDLESQLSAMCIRMENYGTCCSTVITVDRDGMVNFTEKTFAVGDRQKQTANFSFKIYE